MKELTTTALLVLAVMGCSEQLVEPRVSDGAVQTEATVAPDPQPTSVDVTPPPAPSAASTTALPDQSGAAANRGNEEKPIHRPGVVEGHSLPVSQDPGGINAGGAASTGPRSSVSMGGPSVSGGTIDNAGPVIAGMAAGFRRCYSKGLADDPKMKGTVRITAEIGPNGEVKGVTTSGGQGLSGTVINCLAGRVSAAQFDKPSTGSATVVIPASFRSE